MPLGQIFGLTVFDWHNSSGKCLHLARTNISPLHSVNSQQPMRRLAFEVISQIGLQAPQKTKNHSPGAHELGAHPKFWNPMTTPSGRICTAGKKERLITKFPKFSGARVCKVIFKHLPQPHIRSFGTIGQLLKIPPFSAQKCHSAGAGGPWIVF